MAILSEIKGIVDLFVGGCGWARNRLDPVRAQAQRVIDVFEAYNPERAKALADY